MPFSHTTTSLEGVLVITPITFSDSRGIFFESFKKSDYQAMGIDQEFVQENQSFSHGNVIRGLHFQKGEHAQGKLVQVVQGCIYDVAVDFNSKSPTYKQWFGIMLSDLNKKLLWIPAGYAHGFSVISESASVVYKCTKEYNADSEAGIRYNDKTLNINWFIQNPIVSKKDLELPSLNELALRERF
jgi:dTDP-4-dehydrorhamnose 3,5-epimerase